MYGGLLLFGFLVVMELWSMFGFDWILVIMFFIYLMVIGLMVGYSLFYWIMLCINLLFLVIWLYIFFLIVVGFGVVVYGEYVSWIIWIGVVFVVFGLLVMNEKVMSWLKRGK